MFRRYHTRLIAADEKAARYFIAADGLRLYCRFLEPKDAAIGVVLVIPGLGGVRKNDYDELGEALVRRGFCVVVLHARGTGCSEGDRGDIQVFHRILVDFEDMVEWLWHTYSGRPVFLLGHSFGGALATLLAQRFGGKISGVVVVNPAYKRAQYVGPAFWKRLMLGANLLFRPAARIVKMGGELRPTLHPEDRREVLSRRNDPGIVMKFSLRYLAGVHNVMVRAGKQAGLIHTPLLMIYGDKDDVLNHASSEEIFAAWKGADKRRVVMQDVGHGVHAVYRAQRIIAGWLQKQAHEPKARGRHSSAAA